MLRHVDEYSSSCVAKHRFASVSEVLVFWTCFLSSLTAVNSGPRSFIGRSICARSRVLNMFYTKHFNVLNVSNTIFSNSCFIRTLIVIDWSTFVRPPPRLVVIWSLCLVALVCQLMGYLNGPGSIKDAFRHRVSWSRWDRLRNFGNWDFRFLLRSCSRDGS